jgi:hypothetical protein
MRRCAALVAFAHASALLPPLAHAPFVAPLTPRARAGCTSRCRKKRSRRAKT